MLREVNTYLLFALLVEVVLDVLVGHGEAEAVIVAGRVRDADAPPVNVNDLLKQVSHIECLCS